MITHNNRRHTAFRFVPAPKLIVEGLQVENADLSCPNKLVEFGSQNLADGA